VIRAGDSLLFAVNPADYTAPDWSVVFSFRAPLGTAIEITSTDDGTGHLLSVAASVTATWAAATYSGIGRALGPSSAVQTFWTGTLQVLPDLTVQGDNFDNRSHARKCLDAIEAVMLGKASKDVLSSSIAGVSISRLTPEQLITWRNYYAAEVKTEEQNLAAQNGQSTGNNILVRFG
jgi:hypothetical protein